MSVHIDSIDLFSQMVDSSDMVLMDERRACDAWTADCEGDMRVRLRGGLQHGSEQRVREANAKRKNFYIVVWSKGVLW
jgi:hypothetical protein